MPLLKPTSPPVLLGPDTVAPAWLPRMVPLEEPTKPPTVDVVPVTVNGPAPATADALLSVPLFEPTRAPTSLAPVMLPPTRPTLRTVAAPEIAPNKPTSSFAGALIARLPIA